MEPIKNNINKGSVRKDLKSFLRSLAVLLLAVMIIFGTTLAWIEGGKLASTLGQNCTVEAGAGLQFISFDKEVQNGKITLPTSEVLEDCSSVDGRNIFIPTVGSIQSSTPGTVSTENLKFRSAVESDKNTKYITQDFIIKSLEGSSSGSGTPIYIGSGSYFNSGASDDSKKAFRLSINFNDGSDPVVICPGLDYEADTRSYSPVSGIKADGSADPAPTERKANAMSKYYYGKKSIFTLPAGESRRVTVTLWLEGTDANCTKALVEGKDIKLNLVLSTQDDNMRTITFVDYSPTSWVKNESATMYVVESRTKASYAMTRTGDITYTASVPNSFKDIYFQRTITGELGDSTDFNSWSKGDTDDLASSTTYYAIGRGEGPYSAYPIDDKNYGYWVKSTAAKMLDIYFTDVTGSYKINEYTKEDGKKIQGHNPFIHYFNSTYGSVGKDNQLKAWNGFEMEYVGQNGSRQSVYHIIVPADSGAKILFNNKCENQDHSHNGNLESVQIALSDYVLDSDPQVKKIGFYSGDGTTGNPKNELYEWDPTSFVPAS